MLSFGRPRCAGIELTSEPFGRQLGETQSYRATARRGERMCDTVTQQCATVAVRHYEATIFGDQEHWKIARYSKIEAVGKFSIAGPFAVGTEIGDRSLDLYGDKIAGLAKREDIGAATIGEREFDKARIADLSKNAAYTAGDHGGANWPNSTFERHSRGPRGGGAWR